MPTRMRRLAFSAAALLLLLAATPARAGTDISVMTQNQYLGGDLQPLLVADEETFNAALVATLQQIAANDFPHRAERLAQLIAKRRPHLVGLQEVWSFHCYDLIGPLPGLGCDDPSIAGAFNDHLSQTVSKLADAGEVYHAVAVVENLDLRDIQLPGLPPGVPFLINGVPALLVALDRDVILARADVVAAGPVTPAPLPCRRPSAAGCNFQAALATTIAGQPLTVERGFVAVDATIDDMDYRFVNTHLETRQPDPANPLSSFFQAAQAAELIATLEADTPAERTLIVVGDINSSPDHGGLPGIVPPYWQFLGSGYVDVWTLRESAADGFTCCQLADLSNPESQLHERIDTIFTRDMPFAAKDIATVGDLVSDKTPLPGPALWPSDHASVTAEILF